MENEEFEQIPWSQLVTDHQAARGRTLYLAAGIVAAVIVGILAARTFGSDDPVVIAGETSVPAAAGESTATTTVPTPATVSLYAEADLMAALPDEAARAAVARAEWFVTDFFMVDQEPQGSAAIRAALPPGASLPSLPQDTESERVSYVEWARTTAIQPLAESLFRITVAFRALGSGPDGAFQRLPVRTVDVVVKASADGSAQVVDLPSPADPAGIVTTAPWPATPADPPQHVVDAAMRRAAGWGTDPVITAAAVAAGGWRISMTAADPVGIRWPVVVWLDATGQTLDVPPWDE
jgi:hypothetical protein